MLSTLQFPGLSAPFTDGLTMPADAGPDPLGGPALLPSADVPNVPTVPVNGNPISMADVAPPAPASSLVAGGPDVSGRPQWQRDLVTAIPAMLSLLIARRMGPAAAAGFLGGHLQGLDYQRQIEAQQAKQQFERDQIEQARRDKLRQHAEDTARWRAKTAADLLANAEGFDTEEERAAYLRGLSPIYQALGIDTEALAATPSPGAPKRLIKAAKQTLDDAMGALTKQGVDLTQPGAMAQYDVPFRGQRISLAELAKVAQMPVAPDEAPRVAKGDDFAQQFADRQKGEEAKLGRPLKPGERAALREKVRREWASAGWKPSVIQTGGPGGFDASAIADEIIAGRQSPDTKGLYRNTGALRTELAKRHYNLAKAELEFNAVKRWLQTANGTQQTRIRQNIATLSESLDKVDQLVKEWDGGGFPVLNRTRLYAAKAGALGPAAQSLANRLDAQIADVTAEFGGVYMGGNAVTDHALGLAAKNLSSDWSKQTLLDAVQQARENILYRVNALETVGPVGLGDKNPYMPEDTGKPETTKTLTAPSPVSSHGTSGPVTVTAPNGKSYTFATQAQADAFKQRAGIR